MPDHHLNFTDPTIEDEGAAVTRGLDMVRKFMQLEKAADALIPAGSGRIAAGQQLAGSQVELGRQAAGTDFRREPHIVVLTYGSTSIIRDARKPLRDKRRG